MYDAAFIALDWGTSSFRLWLIGHDGRVLAERRSAEGMTTAAATGFEAVLEGHLADLGVPATVPALACGMVGARQGWVEAGYVDTPARLAGIAAGAVRVPGIARDVRILPGIARRDPAAPDVIRGEETQILGALAAHDLETATLCMPGTHSKWGRVAEWCLSAFSTFMTGELFAAVTGHTILAHAVAGAPADEDMEAFRQAVAAALAAPARIANLLFQVRGGQLLFGRGAAAARETISGSLIGLEIAGGHVADGGELVLIAAGRLARLYGEALGVAGLTHRVIDADAAVLGGLSLAARSIWPSRP